MYVNYKGRKQEQKKYALELMRLKGFYDSRMTQTH